MARKSKIKVKKVLHTLTMYDSISIERLNVIVKENPEFDEFEIELGEASGHCGCYYSCSCANVEGFFVGRRLETNAERKEREKKKRAEYAAHKRAIRIREIAQLQKLKEQYPDQ